MVSSSFRAIYDDPCGEAFIVNSNIHSYPTTDSTLTHLPTRIRESAMAVYLWHRRIIILLLYYLQVTVRTAAPPMSEINEVAGTVFRGESSAPMNAGGRETNLDKETIQKFRDTFPHLSGQQYHLRRKRRIEPETLINSIEWQKVAQDSLKKDFARLKNDLKDLRGIASEELQNQRNQSVSEILKNFEELKYIHQLLSYHITNQAYVLSGRVPGTWSIQYLTGRLQEVIPARWIRAVGKEKVSTDLIIERLQGLLSEINSLSGANIRFVERNKTSLELQRIVF
ncbi:hypothetical protein Pst134EA_007118 [Puccinia striiformis f. sp. tritici]|uniref:hypothetical protein n=1 Tax=Puccinia striiformis f. sp. tritici TaxID=168172 RepID=UPI0020074271|nr:hypothetical protein Pst134EA_007118 [Puccinia striiformis f. sp. tritici]KAH9469842.1 hypothetical protein Pst134EA_007118 [Puccinia striiformis f. sp. tritici]KAI9608563.1 hypothetical protein H4Q26_004746 [Puccinia striiformis f. sp. tritici PST-130]